MFRKIWLCGAGVSALVMGAAGQAQSVSEMAAKFGARESIQQISLSPDGKHLAVIAPQKAGGEVLQVYDLEAGGLPKSVLSSVGKGDRLARCSWPTNSRIICMADMIRNDSGKPVGFSRMVTLNSDGSDLKQLSERANINALGITQFSGNVIDWTGGEAPGTVLMTRNYVPEFQTGTRLANTRSGLGVDQVDVVTLHRRPVEQPRVDAEEYISDGSGAVRIMGTQSSNSSGYDQARINYYFRKSGQRNWEPLSRVEIGATGMNSGFEPYAVDSALNVVYGFDANEGRSALYRVKLDGTGTRELVLSNPEVDVDSLIRIGRSGRVVGASYATERRQVEFFDPGLRKLSAALGQALPGKPALSFVDSSSDENKLLVLAGSDVNPGVFYQFDRTTKQLNEIMDVRPELKGLTLVQVKPVSFPAADGTSIPGYLTLPPGSSGKNLPAIVMPHGGPSSRDEWGFDWLAQFFAARGFAVLQPNFRGSAGYGSDWFQKNGFQSWRTAIGDIDDAGRWMQAQGIAAPGKLAIVGWSYGGYAALQSGVLEPGLFKAIVAIAPVTDLEAMRQDHLDFTDFIMVNRFIGNGPHVHEASPAQNVERITAPVLMFHGDLDLNVAINQSRLMARKLRAAGKDVSLIEFTGLDHQLDDDSARARVLAESDAFLRHNLGL
jgi:dipeptidyl aminopeptidase/acylaminoacyl peptidase